MDGFKRPRHSTPESPRYDDRQPAPVLPRPQMPVRQAHSHTQRPAGSPYPSQPATPQGADRFPSQPAATPQATVSPQPPSPSQASEPQGGAEEPSASAPLLPPSSPRRMRKLPVVIASLVGIIILAAVGGYVWYTQALEPAGSDETQTVSVEVKQGWSWPNVAKELAEKGAIRSELAFTIYARLEGVALQEATCLIRPSDTSQEIVSALASGCKGDEYKAVMFYPGATIEKPLYKPDHAQLDQTMYVKHVLSKAGYSEAEIEAALSKKYDSPLFAGKPADATLEGYVFGDTYHVDTKATAEMVLKTAFDHMYDVVQKHNIEANFKKHGLNLFEGITLASIVQRELNCEDKPTPERKNRCFEYQRTIAQVFLKRLEEKIPLGADVTFIYAADMMKIPPTIDLESPYNTRKYAGLPPGPIGTPGLLALRAVAEPSDTDYLYFVAGDDGLIYFGKTLAEHEENIRLHCHVVCQL